MKQAIKKQPIGADDKLVIHPHNDALRIIDNQIDKLIQTHEHILKVRSKNSGGTTHHGEFQNSQFSHDAEREMKLVSVTFEIIGIIAQIVVGIRNHGGHEQTRNKMTKYQGYETDFQKTLARFLDQYGVVWCHVANERQTSIKQSRGGRYYSPEGNKLKSMGVKKGVPDVMIFEPHAMVLSDWQSN